MTVNLFVYNGENDTDALIRRSYAALFLDKVCVISKGENGKKSVPGVFLGVTHSKQVTFIAFSEDNFGIDCESLERKIPNRTKIADAYFSEQEKTQAKATQYGFLKMWTRKEAYVKFTGQGIKQIKAVDTLLLPGKFTELLYMGFIVTFYDASHENTQIFIKNN